MACVNVSSHQRINLQYSLDMCIGSVPDPWLPPREQNPPCSVRLVRGGYPTTLEQRNPHHTQSLHRYAGAVGALNRTIHE
jgi:hypothetical protein